MRVTGGKYGGRKLAAPEDRDIRPTSDRARQALFNILAHHDFGFPFALENIAMADLFAGTGALGIEALSRGSRFCLFVEEDAEARGLIRENVEALGLTGASKIWRRDARDLGPMTPGALPREVGTGSRQAMRPIKNPAGGPFGLVFLDPPYGKSLAPPALASLKAGGWLAPDALVVVETATDEPLDAPGFVLLDERVYGAARLRFLKA